MYQKTCNNMNDLKYCNGCLHLVRGYKTSMPYVTCLVGYKYPSECARVKGIKKEEEKNSIRVSKGRRKEMPRRSVEKETKGIFAKRLRALRIEKGLSQGELVKRLGNKIPLSTLSHYECLRAFPSANRLLLLSDFFGVSIKYLIGKSNVRLVHKSKRVYTQKKKSFFRKILDWFLGGK